ncbi:hypothetical protein M422DRAFT_784188 [Sphaerobolus stellatus SS14]|uniref:Uncharacterized protein n=1 Tax=Sphaerobolus stellatus (strain SS14) TaxID=990650 RepID=A0A0C9UX64_SPHS4|nr:hypothetical protein M422DRAFT_784188 [Sphaerobolus stellatus SS14]
MQDSLADPLTSFFTSYDGFDYNRDNETMAEFGRLCRFMHWGKRNATRREALSALQEALRDQFDAAFGKGEDRYQQWSDLCGTIGISPVPDSITQCRTRVKNVFVNIFDVVDAHRHGKQVERKFRNIHELREYTVRNKKIFSKKRAKKEGLLKYLLKEIIGYY